ncbi:Hypothetical protein NAEGRDRAFT_66066 [Naegleria gruberi]|uniref:F-box domain-containing protein n=1 Tax=Naegleria gruberi TaxID=5762 RepID=D2VB27_NAEGR|nr:uncharacterized protein NAEGRDRAFT_66066 [Naegleria gruberi]EFC46182.1 Hypothetical protein NAEGRDRAFT_66066 [Naegleria gruberi]|eukprot:XP_002678926.1 Hypothetical protein NAEGRDRAFT_66066 [Naegleria gruberi strain NEG-M]
MSLQPSLSNQDVKNISDGNLNNELVALNDVGLNSDQIFQLLMARERTKHLHLELEILDRKRKYSNICDEAKLKNSKKKHRQNVMENACDDVIAVILSYLPNLEGFKLLLVSKQFYRAVGHLRQFHYYLDENRPDLIEFVKSKYFNSMENAIITSSEYDRPADIFNNLEI